MADCLKYSNSCDSLATIEPHYPRGMRNYSNLSADSSFGIAAGSRAKGSLHGGFKATNNRGDEDALG